MLDFLFKRSAATDVPNDALVFVKPHAITDKVIDFVRSELGKHATIVTEGVVKAADIDAKHLVDDHYSALARYALSTKPKDIPVPDDKRAEFKELFGEEWRDVVASPSVLNAADALSESGLSVEDFTKQVRSAGDKHKQLKLAPGLYVAFVEEQNKYVVNGFYHEIRNKFVADGASVHYFVVQFKAAELSWAAFRGDVIGATNPANAKPGSLRNLLFTNWADYGLQTQPSVGDNCVHASAGPLEGVKERMVWTGVSLDNDSFGGALLSAGIGRVNLETWLTNNVVKINGKTGPVFDLLEEKDSGEVLETLKQLDLRLFKRNASIALEIGQSS